MSDVVERLKMRDMSVGEVSDIYREAAAEITRLREEIASLQDAILTERPSFGLAGDPATTRCNHAWAAGHLEHLRSLAALIDKPFR